MKYSVHIIKIFSFLSLLLGSILYILFRPTSLLMFKWINNLGLSDWIFRLRQNLKDTTLPDVVIYSLPNGLWVFSITTLLLIIWKDDYKLRFKIYLSILLLIVILPEFLQFFEIIPGTFDLIDLLVNLIFFLLPFMLFKYRLVYKENGG